MSECGAGRSGSGEHEAPTIRSSRSVELAAWRKHVPPEEGEPPSRTASTYLVCLRLPARSRMLTSV